MTKYNSAPLDYVFSALADGTRRQMLEMLSHGEASVSQLAKPFGVSLPTIHKHLRSLEQAGFIVHEKRGRVRHIRLMPPGAAQPEHLNFGVHPVGIVKDWVARFENRSDGPLPSVKAQGETEATASPASPPESPDWRCW